MMTKKEMEKTGKSEIEILKAEIEAAFEIIDTLPVDAHDMDVHFWCDSCLYTDDEEE